MSYLNKMLMPDERVLCVAVLHWIIFVPGILLTLAGGILGYLSYGIAAAMVGPDQAAILGKVFAGICFVMALLGLSLVTGAFIRQAATELAVTNRRIIAKYGFISRSTFEIMINRVTGVNFDQTVTGRMLGYGTILVHGAGGDISPVDVINNPQEFQLAIMDILEHSRRPEM